MWCVNYISRKLFFINYPRYSKKKMGLELGVHESPYTTRPIVYIKLFPKGRIEIYETINSGTGVTQLRDLHIFTYLPKLSAV